MISLLVYHSCSNVLPVVSKDIRATGCAMQLENLFKAFSPCDRPVPYVRIARGPPPSSELAELAFSVSRFSRDGKRCSSGS